MLKKGRGSPMFSLALLFAAAFLLLPGCGGEKVSEETKPGLTIEKTGEEGTGGKVKVGGGQGEAEVEVTEFEASEESLGVPIYPRAELVPGSALTTRTTKEDRVLVSYQAEFTTGDDYQKVVTWYLDKIGKPLVSSPEEVAWVVQEEGAIKSVMMDKIEGGARIKIVKLSGALDIDIGG